jgi:hypothetical protein
MSDSISLPNFFIVGAPKAGTTSLYFYLDQHPQIYMSPLKEPNYFADELRIDNFVESARPRIAREMQSLRKYLLGDMQEKRFGGLVSTWEDYLRLFRKVAGEIAIGEATPCYLWSKTAARNIVARNSEAKIIINLRNPIDRAFSQYLHMVTVGSTRKSFREQINANLNQTTELLGPLRPLLEFGHYYEQIKRYMNEFSHAQIHISLYEDLQRDPKMLVSELFSFLGVDPHFPADTSRRYAEPRVPRLPGSIHLLKEMGVWPYFKSIVPRQLVPHMRSLMLKPRLALTMSAADRMFLIDYYRADVEKLASVLNRDIMPWLDPGASG